MKLLRAIDRFIKWLLRPKATPYKDEPCFVVCYGEVHRGTVRAFSGGQIAIWRDGGIAWREANSDGTFSGNVSEKKWWRP